ncbi:hypothetical protein EMIHUDRAFT_450759 [Emiliania huxleyi CCMP1516]|uniref:Uncharacterized protein n=2 Tax=Emiliania huxleyi TaxID=2903 RepID=A0A0D3JFM7_EMIH1|nr:hypothetical protein EMIHUDRAFT_450759 [Emiliania huxleyi CCMP1516]EOD22312.1 hypothetical protein EMIHUDRAFT_450759 [Emiliania huxleyi CCMP1516]|eukprot:XP_005774741.1 hypothetical protein EMIHUDRAFT_450759 [Emiliania huxleyi CCMP1516]
MSEDFETLSAAWADPPGPLTPPSLSLTPSERDLTSSLLSQESFGEIMSIADAARLQQRVCELEAREMARQRQTLLLLFRTEVAEAKADAAAGRPNENSATRRARAVQAAARRRQAVVTLRRATDAARTMQRLARGGRARRRSSQRRTSAIRLQAATRERAQVVRFARSCAACAFIQRAARGMRARAFRRHVLATAAALRAALSHAPPEVAEAAMRCARWSCGGTEVSVLESAVAFREERSRVAPPPRADSVAGSVASSVAEITGLDPAQAASYLELAGGNLEAPRATPSRRRLRQLTAERDQLRDAVKTLSADVLCAERASCDGYAPRSRAASTAAASSAPTRDPFLELLGWQWD